MNDRSPLNLMQETRALQKSLQMAATGHEKLFDRAMTRALIRSQRSDATNVTTSTAGVTKARMWIVSYTVLLCWILAVAGVPYFKRRLAYSDSSENTY